MSLVIFSDFKYTQIERKEVVTLIISNLIIFRFFIAMLFILGVS